MAIKQKSPTLNKLDYLTSRIFEVENLNFYRLCGEPCAFFSHHSESNQIKQAGSLINCPTCMKCQAQTNSKFLMCLVIIYLSHQNRDLLHTLFSDQYCFIVLSCMKRSVVSMCQQRIYTWSPHICTCWQVGLHNFSFNFPVFNAVHSIDEHGKVTKIWIFKIEVRALRKFGSVFKFK